MAPAVERFRGAVVAGSLETNGDLTVGGNITVAGDLTATGGMTITGATTYPDAVIIDDTLQVTGVADFDARLDANLGAAITGGAVTISTTTNAIDIDLTTGAFTLDTAGTGGVSIDAGAASNFSTTSANLTLSTITSGTLAVTSAGALNLSSTTGDWQGTGALTIDSSGGAIGIGTDAVAQAIDIGTGAAARTITIGNATGATALVLNAGTGNLSIGQQANAQAMGIKTLTESHTLAAAGTSDTAIQIPANSVVMFVSVRVTTEITGCTTFDIGIAGATTRYGTGLALTAGITNAGADPRAYTAATALRFTAVGGGASFTAGVVRTTIHYFDCTPPTS